MAPLFGCEFELTKIQTLARWSWWTLKPVPSPVSVILALFCAVIFIAHAVDAYLAP
jgi:hypothetical protein